MRHEVGLHARPSVKLTKLAKAFESRIDLACRLRPLGRRQEHSQGNGYQGTEGFDDLFSRGGD